MKIRNIFYITPLCFSSWRYTKMLIKDTGEGKMEDKLIFYPVNLPISTRYYPGLGSPSHSHHQPRCLEKLQHQPPKWASALVAAARLQEYATRSLSNMKPQPLNISLSRSHISIYNLLQLSKIQPKIRSKYSRVHLKAYLKYYYHTVIQCLKS